MNQKPGTHHTVNKLQLLNASDWTAFGSVKAQLQFWYKCVTHGPQLTSKWCHIFRLLYIFICTHIGLQPYINWNFLMNRVSSFDPRLTVFSQNISPECCVLKHTSKIGTILTNTIKPGIYGIGSLCSMNMKLGSKNNLLGETLNSLIFHQSTSYFKAASFGGLMYVYTNRY